MRRRRDAELLGALTAAVLLATCGPVPRDAKSGPDGTREGAVRMEQRDDGTWFHAGTIDATDGDSTDWLFVELPEGADHYVFVSLYMPRSSGPLELDLYDERGTLLGHASRGRGWENTQREDAREIALDVRSRTWLRISSGSDRARGPYEAQLRLHSSLADAPPEPPRCDPNNYDPAIPTARTRATSATLTGTLLSAARSGSVAAGHR